MAVPPPGEAAGRELGRLRERTLSALREVMSDADIAGVRRCAERLHGALPNERLSGNTVLVAYGGGKDSTYTLAFVRAMQLIMFAVHGETFRMRSVTNRHAGMPQAVMENMERAYWALAFQEDPACEALLVDGDEVKPFRRDEPLPAKVVERNRLDLLMTGHRTSAEARPTFCNSCNLSMVNAFGLAAAHEGGVDVIVTGDSPREQRSYQVWINRLGRRFGTRSQEPAEPGFGGFLATTDTIAQTYFTGIYGPAARAEVAERRVAHDVPRGLRFFSIFDDTRYSSEGHWRLLTGRLGFVFDDLAFSFTESDCGNPTLMAHLRGLKCERLYRRPYSEGLREYVEFAVALMRRKEIPERLVARMRERYAGGPDAAERMRAVANGFAMDAYGIGEEQLVCMVYSPLPGKGHRIEEYLRREQPGLAPHARDVHELLDGEQQPADERARALAAELERICGLGLERLRVLYRSPAVDLSADPRWNLMSAVLAGDPHKDVIETRHAPDGPVVRELLSGR